MIYDDNSFSPELLNNPGLLEKVLEALPVPVFYRDKEGHLLAINKKYEDFTGYSKSQILGKTVFDLHPVEIAEFYASQDKELFDSQGNQTYETKHRLPDGSLHDIIFNKAIIKDEKGELVGMVGTVQDITDHRKAERKLEKAEEATVIASAMLHKIKAGVIIVDQDMKVIDSNEWMANLLGEEISELYETIPGLRGAELKELVPDMISKMFSSIMVSGENMLERDIKFQNRLLHISVITIYKNRVVGALIRDMSAPRLVREEIISRAQRANKQNLETVQKIAFLLGENASVTEELLNSIIESYKYGEEDE